MYTLIHVGQEDPPNQKNRGATFSPKWYASVITITEREVHWDKTLIRAKERGRKERRKKKVSEGESSRN